MEAVKLGQKVRDRITGLEGIVIARTEWMYGCVRLVVQPQELKDGRPVDSCQIDEPQAEILDSALVSPESPQRAEERKHGPKPDAVRPATPSR